MRVILLSSVFKLISNIIYAQQIEITISNIRNTEGNILLSFYTNPDSFPYHPEIKKIVEKTQIIDGNLNVNFNEFEPGEYAITLLDDDNSDGDMNYKFFLPKEGYGFSDYMHSGLLIPSFTDCSFVLSDTNTKVYINVTYF